LSIGDQVVSTIAHSDSTGSFAVGDVGTVKGPCNNASVDRWFKDEFRVEQRVLVEFAGGMKASMVAATSLVKADSRLGAYYRSGRLAGGLSIGDQVVSTIAHSDSTGTYAVGDVGTVKGPCNNASLDRVEERVLVEFAGMQNVNPLTTLLVKADSRLGAYYRSGRLAGGLSVGDGVSTIQVNFFEPARTRWLSYRAMVHAQPSPDWKDLGLFWEHEPTPLQCAQKRLAFALMLRACATHPLLTDVDVAELVGNKVVTRADPRPRCREIMRKLGSERGCKWLETEWVAGTCPLAARVVDTCIANGFALAVQRKLVCSGPLVIYSLLVGSQRLPRRTDYQDTTFSLIRNMNREGCSETKPRSQRRKAQNDAATFGKAGENQHGKGGVVDSRGRAAGTNDCSYQHSVGGSSCKATSGS
jgi:hypothetical protein